MFFGYETFCLVLPILSFFVFTDGASDGNTLELVITTFRHGERTPYNFFRNDPYADPKYWPDGNVQLIASGKRRMYNLGRSLRKRYENFLTNSPREVYARSSFQDRCIESAQLVLHGIYRAEDRWEYDNSTEFLPVPIHTVPTADDGMLTVDCDCPEATDEKMRLLHDDISTGFMRNYSRTLDLIYNDTGAILTDLRNISDYYVTLLIERDSGLKIPDWMDNLFFEDLQTMSDYSYYAVVSSEKIQRLRMSNLFADIKERMIGKTLSNDTGTTASRLIAYSTHDNMLAAMLVCLDAWNFKMPPYGATLIIELHRNPSGRRFVKLFYWNETELPEPHPIPLSYCNNSNECSFDNFITRLEKFILDDWRAECGLIDCKTVWNDPFFVMLVALIGMLLLASLLWWLRYRYYYCAMDGYSRIPS